MPGCPRLDVAALGKILRKAEKAAQRNSVLLE
jgi:hypothetical protein